MESVVIRGADIAGGAGVIRRTGSEALAINMDNKPGSATHTFINSVDTLIAGPEHPSEEPAGDM
jgi:hypothetical protein